MLSWQCKELEQMTWKATNKVLFYTEKINQRYYKILDTLLVWAADQFQGRTVNDHDKKALLLTDGKQTEGHTNFKLNEYRNIQRNK